MVPIGWTGRRSSGVALAIGAGASLEWLPQENIVFDRAHVRMITLVDLAEGACYIGWDITRLGRTASGERFEAGELRSRTEVQRAGRRLWGDYAQIEGGAALLRVSGRPGRTPGHGDVARGRARRSSAGCWMHAARSPRTATRSCGVTDGSRRAGGALSRWVRGSGAQLLCGIVAPGCARRCWDARCPCRAFGVHERC